jgi:hypothetical protein
LLKSRKSFFACPYLWRQTLLLEMLCWIVFRCCRCLTLILLTWSIGWARNNASKWQIGFNWAFKGLMYSSVLLLGARCWWRSWLKHCATTRKVAGSIPDGVIGIFHWHNLSGRTLALGLTQPLTEMSTRNNSWGVKGAGA